MIVPDPDPSCGIGVIKKSYDIDRLVILTTVAFALSYTRIVFSSSCVCPIEYGGNANNKNMPMAVKIVLLLNDTIYKAPVSVRAEIHNMAFTV